MYSALSSIPGPIEVSDEVLLANAHPSMSHVSPDVVQTFGESLQMTREVMMSTEGQPFLIAGSGTLGWDQVAANLIQPGDNALVLHTGYFGDSFAECLETYGAKVDQLKAEIGAVVSQDAIEAALKAKNYRVITVTHVDTSTSKSMPFHRTNWLIERHRRHPGCCLFCCERRYSHGFLGHRRGVNGQSEGTGCPPGLSILVASPKAIKVFESRSVPVASYYASWKKWLPIMKAYESGKPAYFATPPVNLIYAYHESLTQITKRSPSLEERIQLHREASKQIKEAAAAVGLKQVARDPACAANGMTALYFPEGVTAGDVIGKFAAKGLIIAGGLHAEIKDKYFRIGHMGVTAVDTQRGDIQALTAALKDVFGK
ncbi:Aminotran-5 domain-containing protein [Mycena kentingensis (nom. inval.)]|nr:Aminotran-5 domain-containing protein [Mycena kentingensis (nom. inval.)]